MVQNRIEECFIDHCIYLFNYEDLKKEMELKIQFQNFQNTKKNPKKENQNFQFDWDKMKSTQIKFDDFANNSGYFFQNQKSVYEGNILYKMSFLTPYGSTSKATIEEWEKKVPKLFPQQCVPFIKVFEFNGGDFVSQIFDAGLEWW